MCAQASLHFESEAMFSQFLAAAQLRLNCFEFLATYLLYPESEQQALYESGEPLNQLEQLAREQGFLEVVANIERSRQGGFAAFDGVGQPNCTQSAFSELRCDFSRIFYVEHQASLYGGHYAPTGSDELAQVTRIFKSAGLLQCGSSNERNDHLALEFDYLYYLTYMEIAAVGANDQESAYEWQEEARAFWELHMVEFVESFAADVQAAANSVFLVCMAEYLAALAVSPLFG